MYFADVYNDLNRMHSQMARLFDGAPHGHDYPFVQLYTNADHIAVVAQLPGVAKEDVEISVTDDVLTIKGHLKETSLDEKALVLLKEIKTGEFARTIELPSPVDGDKTSAVLKQGILTITMPVREEVKPRKITVKSE